MFASFVHVGLCDEASVIGEFLVIRLRSLVGEQEHGPGHRRQRYRNLCCALAALSGVLIEAKRPLDAMYAADEAVKIFEQVLRDSDENLNGSTIHARLVFQQFQAYHHTEDYYLELTGHEKLTSSIELFRVALANDPSNTDGRIALAFAVYTFAMNVDSKKDLVAIREEAIALYRQLTAEKPENMLFGEHLADLLDEHAIRESQNKGADAKYFEFFKEAVERYDDLAKKHPMYRQPLIRTCHNYADRLHKANQDRLALELLEKGISIHDEPDYEPTHAELGGVGGIHHMLLQRAAVCIKLEMYESGLASAVRAEDLIVRRFSDSAFFRIGVALVPLQGYWTKKLVVRHAAALTSVNCAASVDMIPGISPPLRHQLPLRDGDRTNSDLRSLLTQHHADARSSSQARQRGSQGEDRGQLEHSSLPQKQMWSDRTQAEPSSSTHSGSSPSKARSNRSPPSRNDHPPTHDELSFALTSEGAQIVTEGSHKARLWNALPADSTQGLSNQRRCGEGEDCSRDSQGRTGQRYEEEMDHQATRRHLRSPPGGSSSASPSPRVPAFALQVEKLETYLTAEILSSGAWKKMPFKKYNFDAEESVPRHSALHPLLKVREEFRNILNIPKRGPLQFSHCQAAMAEDHHHYIPKV
ncbi:hypothetical protein A4X09_0g1889 [Tilletia walkeri]|uniref:Uncharacterized protein n=1 Tax=Tilletia walkeri TaxID=117179 RepID=A0A8X7T720_9BASI|nr:hypothetical protein A4X09_0g1889 [Tilletia walkeri]